MYHNKIKGLTESEAAKQLEKIYNDWYLKPREQKAQEALEGKSPEARVKTEADVEDQ